MGSKVKTPIAQLWIFCDGSTGSTAGQWAGGGGAAAVARAKDGAVVGWEWQPLARMTNNEAEYAGLLLGLRLARTLGGHEVTFVLDSEVVVGQMVGRFAVNSPALRRWHWQACAAVRTLPVVHFRLVAREWNRLADGLAAHAGLPWAAVLGELEKSDKVTG